MAYEQPRFKRVEPDDPHRCQGTAKGSGGQCIFEAVEYPQGVFHRFCTLHDAGNWQIKKAKKEARRLYDIQRYGDRIKQFVDEGGDVHLDEELGILRMTLEHALNRYGEVELITMSGNISNLVRDIRDTLVANNKVKAQMGALMDRATIDRLLDEVMMAVVEHIDPSKVDVVCQGVAAAVARAQATARGLVDKDGSR